MPCPSSPATFATNVRVDHWTPRTSQSCEVRIVIRVECECVLMIATDFYPSRVPSSHEWNPTTWTLLRPCALHAEQPLTEPLQLSLCLRPYTDGVPSGQIILRDYASLVGKTSRKGSI